jgi:NAD(P)-dependent dehydrogenase (short-subunit alcohol dehydrogenase family)
MAAKTKPKNGAPAPKKARSARHIVVTGAGTGIGRAIALRLASEGAFLSLFARDAKRLEETAALAKREGAGGVYVESCDIRREAQVVEAFANAAGRAGPFHVLVANAGIGGANVPGKKDRFEDLVRTNLLGTYYCLRAAEAHLASGPEVRHLVAISSILGRIGVAGYSGYCASKAGILGLVRALAMELAPKNVQVNAVCPGWVSTDMAHEGLEGMAKAMGVSKEEALKAAMQDVPLGRMSEPEDVAGLVRWLVSVDALGVTGQGLDMNGGAFMH